MSRVSVGTKRLLLGRPFRSDTSGDSPLRKRIALPVFASDALSSVAYAPEEIFLILSLAGMSALVFTPWVGLAVAVVMVVVIACYRQNVRAYPSGDGDYEVATVNLGPNAGLGVGAALLIDYVLTVAVSISAAAANIGSAIPFVYSNEVVFAVVAIVLLTAINLRGIRESRAMFAIPVYAFMAAMTTLVVWGLFQVDVLDRDLRAESADFELVTPDGVAVAGLALAFVVAKSFASGCAALTGVEAIHNGVPAFRSPRARNAATTLVMLGVVSISFLLGLIVLANKLGVQIAEDPAAQLIGAPEDYHQKTMIAQLADPVFAGLPVAFYVIMTITTLILVLAANTAFNGFPVLASVLARDKYLPRQLATRGDRLAFSNGIVLLAIAAIVLVVAFDAQVTVLIQLYIVGVFVAFTLSQLGMVRHWTRRLESEEVPAVRRRVQRARAVNGVGFVLTSGVLVIVMGTKFFAGAYIAVLAMLAVFGVMKLIKRHYESVARELEDSSWEVVLPSRTHCVVLVSKLHLPTLRALAYARATRPDTIEALTVNIETTETRVLVREWERRRISVPLKVVESPYREINRPVVDYVKRLRDQSPRDVVIVYIPEYVVGHWWEQLLHNQSALRLKTRLLYERGVMVTSVPWQLSSSDGRAEQARDEPIIGRWGAPEDR
ncbi:MULTISPECIES: APC family permease [unclassified Dietzia]|uniref:APC family permease n=1 Tax=unclassified Dietzia TaxID=2617939 RepID=UPI000D20576D|nr:MULTISPECIES: APC family permease [unclassified Dietzia]AVZ41167.1 DNA-binding protein [Dietzia sp. JS16-p6b]MBB1025513.1 APC family permease [Dietzia sp. DQ12-76]MBB1026114.1 APC family permease [Dietzia sp. DQ11-38-2]